MDPSEKIRGIKSTLLKDKKIALGITGSVSAEETVKLARDLIRHGAYVYPIMSEESLKIITPTSLQFATGKEPITEITGLTEHVLLEEECDLLLIAPCSANTISKISYGIGDTTVTLFALTFLGSKQILIAPAMSGTMWKNPIIVENIKKLKSVGVNFIDPKIEEGKAKLPDIETIVANTIRLLNNRFNGKRVLVIGGATEEPIDDVRVITNRSSGGTSIEIAKAFFMHGAQTTLLLGRTEIKPPDYIRIERFKSLEDLISMIDEMKNFDLIIVPAAISDFKVLKSEGKIKSNKPFTLELVPTPKFLENLRKKYTGDLIAFKAEFDENRIIEEARQMIEKYNLKFVVGNRLTDVKENQTSILIINKDNVRKFTGTKFEAAIEIMNEYIQR